MKRVKTLALLHNGGAHDPQPGILNSLMGRASEAPSKLEKKNWPGGTMTYSWRIKSPQFAASARRIYPDPMNLKHIALFTGLCAIVVVAASCASSLPPASIAPALDNDTNPPKLAKNATGVLGTINRLDLALDKLLPPDAKVEILVDGVDWAEGPVWFHHGLNFSDVKQNTQYRWTLEAGVSVYLKPSGYTAATPRGGEPGSNALTLDRQGRLVMCQHGDRRVVRLEKDGKTLTVLADRYEGKRLNSPFLKYDIQPDGNIANGRVFFDTTPMVEKKLPGLPDGIKLDLNGNIWATGPGGVFIFSPEGKHLGTLATGVPTANLNWGGDGSTLYICANHNVCRIKTLTKGVMAGALFH